MELSCSYGTLDVLSGFGLSKDDKYKCSDIIMSDNTELFIFPNCSNQNTLFKD